MPNGWFGYVYIRKDRFGFTSEKQAAPVLLDMLFKLEYRGYDFDGIAYDGDADRCLCVDEKSNVIAGGHILYIYGFYY